VSDIARPRGKSLPLIIALSSGRRPRRLHGALLLGALLLGGCTMSLREVRAQEPLYTRRGVGAAPEAAAHCVQDYLEDRFGGVFGSLSGVVYEARREAAASHLIGRSPRAPSNVVFTLSLTPAGINEMEAQLRMTRWRLPGMKTAVIEGIEACVRQAS